MRIGDEGSLTSAALAGRVVFVATAERAASTGVGLGGVRSAMARAAQLLELDVTPAPDARAPHRTATSLRTPSRRRTRRYAERQRHPVAS